MSTLFSLLFLLVLMVGSGCLGALLYARLLACDRQVEREQLQACEAALQADFDALQARQQVAWAFWQARQHLRAEAERARRGW